MARSDEAEPGRSLQVRYQIPSAGVFHRAQSCLECSSFAFVSVSEVSGTLKERNGIRALEMVRMMYVCVWGSERGSGV